MPPLRGLAGRGLSAVNISISSFPLQTLMSSRRPHVVATVHLERQQVRLSQALNVFTQTVASGNSPQYSSPPSRLIRDLFFVTFLPPPVLPISPYAAVLPHFFLLYSEFGMLHSRPRWDLISPSFFFFLALPPSTFSKTWSPPLGSGPCDPLAHPSRVFRTLLQLSFLPLGFLDESLLGRFIENRVLVFLIQAGLAFPGGRRLSFPPFALPFWPDIRFPPNRCGEFLLQFFFPSSHRSVSMLFPK